MKAQRHGTIVCLLGLLGLLAGCAAPPEAGKADPGLAQYVLTSVPADVQNRTLVDFGGAVHLVGWDLDAKATAAPGSTLRLKFYWRSVKKLSDGWGLFTHLVAPGAPKPYAFDGIGPLRESVPDTTHGRKQKLAPSDWVPGLVYVDEQDIKIPDLSAEEVTLSVGLHREALQVVGRELDGLTGLRLPILSGLSDGENRAVVARLATGVNPHQKRSKTDKKPKPERRPGGAERAPQGKREPLRPGTALDKADAKATP
ncbi:MAG TPA: hypothetical protein VGK73_36495 [Polyangiaceae bacterium]